MATKDHTASGDEITPAPRTLTENLVVQGYGEADPLVPTEAAEPRNRRVEVRVITPLLAAAR